VITVLTGDNSFELTRAIDEIVRTFDGVAEKFEGGDLELSQLPDLLQGGTLFASERLVIVREVSENKALWDALPDWLGRVSDDVHVVLIEPKPDKRTKTFKDLQKKANVQSFTVWSDRDTVAAESWVIEEAKKQGLVLDKKSAQTLVSRVGIDQWQLFHALEKLAVLDTVTPEVIEKVIEAHPSENVFNLLDAALRGDSKKIAEMIPTLERTQDPYMTFGLLAGQVFQLTVLAVATKPTADIAKDIGAHPYALGKLAPHAKRLGLSNARKIAKIFADTDIAMKSTGADPWLLIEEALIKTASL
tara:strand:- start:2216 stop:3124 length:909 start_codon:yes stop_codon:yes gene_type:complete